MLHCISVNERRRRFAYRNVVINTQSMRQETFHTHSKITIHIWCKNNGMILNSAKTKVMFVTTKQKRQRLDDDNLNLLYNNDPLQAVTNDKILVVFVDNNLTWSEHIEQFNMVRTQRKLCQIFGYFRKLSPSYHKTIGYNFKSLIFNLILTFVISHGAVWQKQTNLRF